MDLWKNRPGTSPVSLRLTTNKVVTGPDFWTLPPDNGRSVIKLGSPLSSFNSYDGTHEADLHSLREHHKVPSNSQPFPMGHFKEKALCAVCNLMTPQVRHSTVTTFA